MTSTLPLLFPAAAAPHVLTDPLNFGISSSIGNSKDSSYTEQESVQMLQVKVRLCQPLKEIAGESELVVNMEDRSSLQDLVGVLTEKYGQGLKKRYNLHAGVSFSQHFLISVNNKIVSAPNLASVQLKAGDTVEALEPVVGG